MKTRKFSEALGNIDERYIADALGHRHKKRHIALKVLGAAACVCIVGGCIEYALNGCIDITHLYPEERIIQEAEPIKGWEPEISTNTEPKALLYSELVNHGELPDIDIGGGTASVDIDAFEESDIAQSCLIVEGEVLSISTKRYDFTTYSDKFEQNGILNNFRESVVYTMRVDRVLYGDAEVGEVITVEDEFFPIDPLVTLRESSRYIIPMYDAGDLIYRCDDYANGDISRESNLSTLDSFIPQIEVCGGGYIVPDCWESLAADCEKIIVDTEPDNYFADKMYFVPNTIMSVRFDELLKNTFFDVPQEKAEPMLESD